MTTATTIRRYQFMPTELTNRLTMKNVKKGFGHDLMGFHCDLYLNKKRIGYYDDDGYGGEPTVVIDKPYDTKLNDLFVSTNFKQHMIDVLDWGDLGETIDFDTMVSVFTERIEVENHARKKETKGVLFGTQRLGMTGIVKFRQPLDILVSKFGNEKVTKYINDIITNNLGDDEVILSRNLDEFIK